MISQPDFLSVLNVPVNWAAAGAGRRADDGRIIRRVVAERTPGGYYRPRIEFTNGHKSWPIDGHDGQRMDRFLTPRCARYAGIQFFTMEGLQNETAVAR